MKQQGNHEEQLFRHAGETFVVGDLVTKTQDCLKTETPEEGGGVIGGRAPPWPRAVN